MKKTIMIADDELSIREAVILLLESDYNVISVESGEEAIEKVNSTKIDVILLDIIMKEMDGIEALKRIKEIDPAIEVIMITATRTVETAVQAIKLGAYEYVTKPFDKDKITTIVKRALEKKELSRENIILRDEIIGQYKYREIIGKSKKIKEIIDIVEKVANEDVSVLISGESGTGKEVIARAIHQKSKRVNRPFVAVNCGAIPAELVESELFGHEKGAFTSAVARHIGKFEYASEGTIFLDDIVNLPMSGQSKLLRVLQEKEIVRIGSNKIIPVDVRVISSTNVDLQKAIVENKFREDLYYRLKVIPVFVPPLRERKEDIPLFVSYFLNEANMNYHKNIKEIKPDAMEALVNYNWPGNIRELRNVIEMFAVLSVKDAITLEDMPSYILAVQYEMAQFEGVSLGEALAEFESQFIMRIMQRTKWNQKEAARLLGIHRNTLITKLKELEKRDNSQ